MNMRKLTSILMTTIAGFVAILTIAGNSPAFADDGTQRVSMLLLNLPYFLILMIGAGAIGSIVFLFIVGAEALRRRKRKYSCIQH
jgi:integral membrane sensor domain MASE1